MQRVVFFFLLSSISILGDNIFLTYVSLTLLQKENGGLLSATILGLDAFFEIVVGPFLARYVDAVGELKTRLKLSFLIQIVLSMLALFPAMLVKQNAGFISIALSIAIMRLLSLYDTQLKSVIPLYLDKTEVTSLMRSLSLSIFSQRCIFLISSSLAPIFMSFSWFFVCSVNSVSHIFAMCALLVILKIVSTPFPATMFANDSSTTRYPLKETIRKKWIQWNCLALLLSSAAFGSVTLILTKSMLLERNHSFMAQILHGPAPLYAGLLISLFLMLLYPMKSSILSTNSKKICFFNAILGLGLVIAAFLSSYIQCCVFLILGILNGFSLVGTDAFVQRKIEGKDFVKAIAKGSAFGKIGILLSLTVAGFCIDNGVTLKSFFVVSGSFAILASIFLFSRAFPLEEFSEEQSNPVALK